MAEKPRFSTCVSDFKVSPLILFCVQVEEMGLLNFKPSLISVVAVFFQSKYMRMGKKELLTQLRSDFRP